MDNHCHPTDTHLQMHGCFPAFHVTKVSSVEPGYLTTTLVKRATVEFLRMQIRIEIFHERCKFLNIEFKTETVQIVFLRFSCLFFKESLFL